jgi:hypothetical protein
MPDASDAIRRVFRWADFDEVPVAPVDSRVYLPVKVKWLVGYFPHLTDATAEIGKDIRARLGIEEEAS